MTLRVVIVDDEPLAREGVALCLKDEADVAVVASCADGADAIRAIRELAPDLVFLDVKMPGMSGFDVIEAIGLERMPAVIFLTAYDEYALRAFRVEAIDYLLKPLDGSKLAEALARARASIAQRDLLQRTNALASALARLESLATGGDDRDGRIAVRSGAHVHFLRPQDVLWVEADGDYVTVHAADQKYLVRESMRDMEARLARYHFKRVHRSSLVSLPKVRELEIKESGDCEVVLEDGTRLRVGRAYKSAVLDYLNARS